MSVEESKVMVKSGFALYSNEVSMPKLSYLKGLSYEGNGFSEIAFGIRPQGPK